MTNEQYARAAAILSGTSPENLHMDGEISRTEAKRRGARLKREWKALVAEVGRPISEMEVYDWMRDQR